MKIPIYQVDAFAERLFEGNPAAVVPLPSWLDDELLQAIAAENNLSETAFVVAGQGHWELRWFTPRAEVDLCGHATLATAHVLFNHLGCPPGRIEFHTRSGRLHVEQASAGLRLDFPAIVPVPLPMHSAAAEGLLQGLGAKPEQLLAAPDYIAVFADQASVASLEPDFARLAGLDRRGVIATAPGDHHDFASRCFYPKLGVNEDPVTGSAHCKLTPYWAERLGRSDLQARQISARGGTLVCQLRGDRVWLIGQAVDYLQGEIKIIF